LVGSAKSQSEYANKFRDRELSLLIIVQSEPDDRKQTSSTIRAHPLAFDALVHLVRWEQEASAIAAA